MHAALCVCHCNGFMGHLWFVKLAYSLSTKSIISTLPLASVDVPSLLCKLLSLDLLLNSHVARDQLARILVDLRTLISLSQAPIKTLYQPVVPHMCSHAHCEVPQGCIMRVQTLSLWTGFTQVPEGLD